MLLRAARGLQGSLGQELAVGTNVQARLGCPEPVDQTRDCFRDKAAASAAPRFASAKDEDRALHPTLSSLLLCERRDVEAIAAAAAATQRSIETVC